MITARGCEQAIAGQEPEEPGTRGGPGLRQWEGAAAADPRSLATVARSSCTSRVSSATRPGVASRDSASSRMRRISR